MLNRFQNGIDRILSEDKNSQIHYLNVIAEIRYIDIDYLFKLGAFFVPNPEYILRYFGTESMNPMFDLYDSYGDCKWVGHLMIPIRDVMNEIIGFVGYNPFSQAMRKDNELLGKSEVVPPKYIVSSKKVFDRNAHMLVPNGYKKMLEEQYVVVVDGVFDSITLASMGLNSSSALGSDFGDKIKYKLSFVKNKFVAHDNDPAGLKLFNEVSSLGNTYAIRQSRCKDIDKYIKDYGAKQFLEKLENELRSPIPKSIFL